jgi:peptide deformylase
MLEPIARLDLSNPEHREQARLAAVALIDYVSSAGVVGMAAPQLGMRVPVLVVAVPHPDPAYVPSGGVRWPSDPDVGNWTVMINGRVTNVSSNCAVRFEACASGRDDNDELIEVPVPRPDRVAVEYWGGPVNSLLVRDVNGWANAELLQRYEEVIDHPARRVYVQHELDHTGGSWLAQMLGRPATVTDYDLYGLAVPYPEFRAAIDSGRPLDAEQMFNDAVASARIGFAGRAL